jgi:hypothetical protein
MNNRGVIRVYRGLLDLALMLPEGYHVVGFGTEYMTDELVFGVEGPAIPKVEEGCMLPSIQLVEHTKVDEDGMVWKRREIGEVVTEPWKRQGFVKEDSRTLS